MKLSTALTTNVMVGRNGKYSHVDDLQAFTSSNQDSCIITEFVRVNYITLFTSIKSGFSYI